MVTIYKFITNIIKIVLRIFGLEISIYFSDTVSHKTSSSKLSNICGEPVIIKV